MNQAIEVLSPNRVISKQTVRWMVGFQLVLLFFIWIFSPTVFLPKPKEVLNALNEMWMEGLGGELITSFYLNLQAIALATLLSLGMAYLTVIPFFRPIVTLLSKLRFLSMVGLTFFFTLMATTGHELKLFLLVFSVSVFFVTGMAEVVASIPKEKYDLARTLRMGEWRVVYEVVIIGQADKAFEVLRQNAAMGWMMLTMVEGISRSEGGVGAMLLNQNKHFHLSAVFAIQLTILLLGLAQDYAIGLLRTVVCPYADLTLERK
ncbi:MAG: nitrate ABC transporter permease [Acidobacteria bacterium]|nr:MAG: nitrate ABC transporter permease [Acidobacteriota bacterium]